jgi:hypothetical protein
MLYILRKIFTNDALVPYANYRVDIREMGTNSPVRIYNSNGLLISQDGITGTDGSGVVTCYVGEDRSYSLVLRHPISGEVIQRVTAVEVGEGSSIPEGPTGPTGAPSSVTGPTGWTGPSVTGPTGAPSSVTGPTGATGPMMSMAAPTTQYTVDANRLDSYTENGSLALPFKTIAAAVAQVIADGHSDANPAWIGIAGKMTETVSLVHGGEFFRGMLGSGTHAPIVLTGGWTLTGADGTLDANHFSIQELEIVGPSTGSAIHFTGTQPQRLFMKDVWLTAQGVGGTGLLVDNSGSGSIIEIDDIKISHTAVTGDNYCIDVTRGSVSIDDLETSGSHVQVAIVRTGATLVIRNGELDASGDEAIHVQAGGVLTVGISVITNTQANSSGIMLDSGAVAVLGETFFNIPAGTGYAINGVAGAVCYYPPGGLSFYPGSNSTINPAVTMIPLVVTP